MKYLLLLLMVWAVRFDNDSLMKYEADFLEEKGGVFYLKNYDEHGGKHFSEIVVAIPVNQIRAIQRERKPSDG